MAVTVPVAVPVAATVAKVTATPILNQNFPDAGEQGSGSGNKGLVAYRALATVVVAVTMAVAVAVAVAVTMAVTMTVVVAAARRFDGHVGACHIDPSRSGELSSVTPTQPPP